MARRTILGIALGAALWPAVARAQGSPQQVYAIVVDSDGFPVRGLSAEDFSLRDGSVRQAVLGAEPAANPVWLAIVVRGFETQDLPQVRGAIEAIAATTTKGVAGSHVGVMRASSAGASEWVDATTGVADGVWSSVLTNPAPVLDAIGQAAGALRKAPTDRRAVVLLIKRSPSDTVVVQNGLVTDQLFNTGAALWTVEVPGSSTAAGPVLPANAAKFDDVLTDATKFSGSLRERVSDLAALTPMAQRVANLVLAQYVVTYLWPNPMLSTLSIATRHDRGDVLVPAWAR
jgi:hypothetical protein